MAMRRGMRAVPLALALVGTVGVTGCGYNAIQRLDETANQAQHNIEVQLQRRNDLIGNLVETVKGQAKQELDVFKGVAQARSGLTDAINSHDPQKMADANLQLSSQVTILNRSVAEAYPQLKSDQAFLRLQDELTGTENRIAVSRTDYNEAAGTYNAYIRQFPQVVTARISGAKPRTYFTATAESQTAPKVDFSTKPDTSRK
ncbi:MAG TPA: LemA family protein [Gemmatimonadaceae bacterium]|jgi:LemA protein|nr:LemA family protein [Gemmatimonadaceae bacterium]